MNKIKIFVCIVVCVVVAAVVAGFFIVDSPKESRLKKFDEQRVNNLSFIQSEILNYWQRKGELPKSLDDLRDDIRGIVIPVDSETQEQFIYKIVDEKSLKFALCAVFSRPSSEKTTPPRFKYPLEQYPFGGQNWEHDFGKVCFERQIDKELYPLIKR